MKKSVFISFLALLAIIDIQAQDEHFSQFFAIPIQINPALAGAYEGTYRMTAIYRDQWNNSLETPYKTFAAGGDTRFNINFAPRSEDHFGLGLFFTSDRVAEFQANTNKIEGFFAYHKKLTKRNPSYIGGGLKMGIIQKNINYDNLTFQDQFNQLNAFDQSTSENLPPNNIGFFDFSLGINYFISVNNKTKYYVGAAAHHLTNPNISLFSRLDNIDPTTDIDSKLQTKINVHLSMDQKINLQYEIQPRFIFQKQGESSQISVGTNLKYQFKSQNTGIVFGVWASALNDLDGFGLDRVTPLLGLIQNAFIFGFSYDIGLRDTLSNPFGFNTFEFSIRFSGVTEDDNIICPTF